MKMKKPQYALQTKVSVSKSQEEVRKILEKYGGEAFAVAENKRQAQAMLMFELDERRLLFRLPLPTQPSPGATQASLKTYDQICRSRWRSLVLAIKAKLECVAAGITTVEEEFMAHIVLPNGQTVGEVMTPQIGQSYQNNEMPPMLGLNPGRG